MSDKVSTVKENPLLAINPKNQTQANDLQHIALQDLYSSLQKKGYINQVPIMEEAPPSESIKENNDLLLRKIISLKDSLL